MTDVVQSESDRALRALVASTGRPMDDGLRARARDVARRHFGPGGAGPTDGLLEEGATLGPWAVERVLGAGGQSVVYLARHVRLPGHVAALKVPHGSQRRALLREAEHLARLDHPGIVKLIDIDPDAPTPWVAVECCLGGSLADRLDAEGPLPEAEVARVGRAVLEALAYAHAAGVVHRDLKPENILFDGTGHVRIADFGIGKVVAEQLSVSLSQASVSSLAGTPIYMAPEQERPGGAIDGRTDLYAVGKLLHHMLTGLPPRTLRPVEQERPGVRPGWSELVFALTATSPAARPADAAAALAALDRVLAPAAPGAGSAAPPVVPGPPTDALAEVAEAAARLRQAHVGALIVVARRQDLRQVVETGRQIDARVELHLLASLFHPGAPLSDGAAIVRDGRLVAAGCFLPLTESEDDRTLGTRHRAARGLTEQSDAVVVVVSEETATISLAEAGRLHRNLDRDGLLRLLREHCPPAPLLPAVAAGAGLVPAAPPRPGAPDGALATLFVAAAFLCTLAGTVLVVWGVGKPGVTLFLVAGFAWWGAGLFGGRRSKRRRRRRADEADVEGVE